jgi:hypothetical protein
MNKKVVLMQIIMVGLPLCVSLLVCRFPVKPLTPGDPFPTGRI